MEAHSKKKQIKKWILTFWPTIPKTFNIKNK